MTTSLSEQAMQTFEVLKDEAIAAPIDIVFETLLEQMGPHNQTADGASLAMKLEPWPGGRWFRDVGNNAGHLWGHVQSIKVPVLLEIQGPLFMSSPVLSHLLYRLTEEGGKTRIKFSHRAVGLIAPEIADGSRVGEGWAHMMARIRHGAESRTRGKK